MRREQNKYHITMTRQEYLEKMQSYREQLQANAIQSRKDLDDLNDQYRQDLTNLNQEKMNKARLIRDQHTDAQNDIERKMHELKVQWAQEHPYAETRIVE